MANATDFQKISSQIRMTLDKMSKGGGTKVRYLSLWRIGHAREADSKRAIQSQASLCD